MIPLEPVEPTSAHRGDGASLRWLLAAPHRLFFFCGMVGLALSSLWWLGHLAGRSFGIPLPLALPPSWLHGWMMTNGFLPFFMFGFLFTAGPKWLHVEPPAAHRLLVPALLALAGFLLALAGAQFHVIAVSAGVLLMTAGWLALLVRFVALLRGSRLPDRLHARLVLIFFAFGTL
ncbi:MAG: NnrS family protein, partial [Sulfuritalea sp.]|nr:NnrS family protein [Sulfuritalea sp.]